MNKAHYTEKLSAYINRELPAGERQEVAAHLLVCDDCRRLHDEIKLGAGFASLLETDSAPPEVWQRIAESLNDSFTENSAASPQNGRWLVPVFVTIAVSVLVIAGLVLRFALPLNSNQSRSSTDGAISREQEIQPDSRATEETWKVERIVGQPKIDDVVGREQIRAGEYLETDAESSARLIVADIGSVEVAPNSRMKLIDTSDEKHRMSLEEGRMHARIVAPPRLFFVETPTATAVDLGCEYFLEVTPDGDSVLRVTSGYVALEKDGVETIVPARASATTRKGHGIGLPVADLASDKFKRAVNRLEVNWHDERALIELISEARPADSLTLWHLLPRVGSERRSKVFDALARYVKPPAGVKRDGVIRLDPAMLKTWWSEVESVWYANRDEARQTLNQVN